MHQQTCITNTSTYKKKAMKIKCKVCSQNSNKTKQKTALTLMAMVLPVVDMVFLCVTVGFWLIAPQPTPQQFAKFSMHSEDNL